MTRIPQAHENPYEPAPVTMAERRAARAKMFDPWGDRRRVRVAIKRPRLPSHVYFVDSNVYCGVTKIGTAFDVELRVRQLQACSPIPLRLVGWVNRGGRDLERTLHKHFASTRSHDEWFTLSLGNIWPVVAAMGFKVEVVR